MLLTTNISKGVGMKIHKIEGKEYKIKSHIPKHICGGCSFFDKQDGCNMPDEEELSCGHGTIYEEIKPQIKPIDEHEWSDGNIEAAHTTLGAGSTVGYINIEGAFENFLTISDEDLKALANARGFKMVKI
jgi:hypothetical protein